MRKLPAVLLALPLGELSPKVTERASPLPQYPLSLLTAFAASSPKGTPLGYAGNLAAATKSRPLGEGGLTRSGKTEGVIPGST